MTIYCLSDPHLHGALPDKSMDQFGPMWTGHQRRIGSHWQNLVSEKDIILIPGDISWAVHWEDALVDLKWLNSLPGKKILLKGNHDLWWKKTSQLRNAGLKTLHFIDGDSVQIGNWEFFGARLWDTSEYHCNDIIDWTTEDGKVPDMYKVVEGDDSDKKYNSELLKLQRSIDSLKSKDTNKIVLFHYPPTTSRYTPTRALEMVSQVEGLKTGVFGHLHQLKQDLDFKPFTSDNSSDLTLHLCSCDHLKMKPKFIAR